MDILSSYSLSQWLLIMLAAFIIGMSKAGLEGSGHAECYTNGFCFWQQIIHRNRITAFMCC
jgi:hypothetical protein